MGGPHLLALNASLEGVRAGEAGRAFTLVATQMQRLAEQVLDGVHGIEEMTADIERTTLETTSTAERTGRLAEGTSRSARRKERV